MVAGLGADELAGLAAIARRLQLGARAYGRLDVHGDPRSWEREAAEEIFDGCVYLAAAVLRGQGRAGRAGRGRP